MSQTYITLNNGAKIPQFGMRVYMVPAGDATIKPAVLHVECHPYFQQNELKKRLAPYGTVIEAWYPIGHGDVDLINEAVFVKLAEKYGKSNVQIILRWQEADLRNIPGKLQGVCRRTAMRG